MKAHRPFMRFVPGLVALLSIFFGLATIVSGGRVLAGADPGYVVFRPLLVYNTFMGAAYVAAGVIAWRGLERGVYAAGAVFGLNLIVLVTIVALYLAGSAVAMDSVRAMTFRTVTWLFLFSALMWTKRRSGLLEHGADSLL